MPSEASRTFPVRFTQAQRQAIADILPGLADRLRLDEANQRMVSLTLDELQQVRDRSRAAVRYAQSGMKRNSLRHVKDIAAEALEQFQGIGSIPPAERIYQFRITLKDIEPPVWRRIQVRDCTLERLHECIQLAFGWWNYHLYEFQIDDRRYGDPWLLHDDVDGLLCDEDSTITKISRIVPRDGTRFRFEYRYDFGDDWQHEVLFEGCLRARRGERYPRCLEGARACPPEDSGGPWGYADYLAAISDTRHEQHEEYLEWRRPFDPEAFDAEKATKKMRRGLPKLKDQDWGE